MRATFPSPQLITWKSFDGLAISGFVRRPPPTFTGKRPVLITIHGGPEAQARPGFIGRWNYFVNVVRHGPDPARRAGSRGFGKTFIALDDGMKREDTVKDIGALLDWIATQLDLDPERVAVEGGSYGGYMSLAVATHYADRIASSIDIVGIANFVTFLERTESYRRDLRRVEYGDERELVMRELLTRISPVNNAERIAKPLLVLHGRNDPRVPYTEAEQIVTIAKKNGVPVWYLLADNEGHGFAKKANADFQFYEMVERFPRDDAAPEVVRARLRLPASRGKPTRSAAPPRPVSPRRRRPGRPSLLPVGERFHRVKTWLVGGQPAQRAGQHAARVQRQAPDRVTAVEDQIFDVERGSGLPAERCLVVNRPGAVRVVVRLT